MLFDCNLFDINISYSFGYVNMPAASHMVDHNLNREELPTSISMKQLAFELKCSRLEPTALQNKKYVSGSSKIQTLSYDSSSIKLRFTVVERLSGYLFFIYKCAGIQLNITYIYRPVGRGDLRGFSRTPLLGSKRFHIHRLTAF